MRIVSPVLLVIASVFFGLPVRDANSDEIFLCDDGPNVVVENSTPEKIAKLRRENACVAKYFEAVERERRAAAADEQDHSIDGMKKALCGGPCMAAGSDPGTDGKQGGSASGEDGSGPPVPPSHGR